jgi:hypothetical protein
MDVVEDRNKGILSSLLINFNGEIDRLENRENIGIHEVIMFDRAGDGT